MSVSEPDPALYTNDLFEQGRCYSTIEVNRLETFAQLAKTH